MSGSIVWNDPDIEMRFAEIEEDERLAELRIDGELIWPMVRAMLFFHMVDHYSRRDQVAILPQSTLMAVLGRQVETMRSALCGYGRLEQAVRIARNERSNDRQLICLMVGLSNELKLSMDGRLRHFIWHPILSVPSRQFRGIILQIGYNRQLTFNSNNIIPGDILLVPLLSVAFEYSLAGHRVVRELFELLLPEFARDSEVDFWKRFCLGGQATRQIIKYFSQKRRAFALLQKLDVACIALRHSLAWPGLISAAKQLRVPVLEFQHGFTDRYYPSFHWPKWTSGCSRKIPFPDHVATFGRYWSTEIEAGGLWPGTNIHSVGSISVDECRYRHLNNTGKIGNKIQILYAVGFTSPSEIEFWIQAAALLIQAEVDFRLVIKCHPKTTERAYALYEHLVGRFPNRIRVFRHGTVSILDLIAQSTIHCAVLSTSHYESIALGIPTIILKFQGWEFMKDLLDRGAARSCDSPDSFVDWVTSSMRQPLAWRDWLRDTFLHRDEFFAPNGIENAVSLINALAREKRRLMRYECVSKAILK